MVLKETYQALRESLEKKLSYKNDTGQYHDNENSDSGENDTKTFGVYQSNLSESGNCGLRKLSL